ncbi:MAG: acyl carrier protein [Ignavibacteria bacterium]
MISERLKKTILETLEIDNFDIQPESTADQVPGWDSLSHINVILAIEKEFNVRFKGVEVMKLKNIGDLQNLVDLKLSN